MSGITSLYLVLSAMLVIAAAFVATQSDGYTDEPIPILPEPVGQAPLG